MQVKVKNIEILQSLTNGYKLCFDIDKQFINQVQESVCRANESLKQGELWQLSFEKVKKKRSLDANAYFHLLVNKIAEALQTSDDEVKCNLILSYGKPLYAVQIPSNENIALFWKYAKYVGEVAGKSEYLLYKPSHELDTKEMARLIDGTIHEAQALGIVTETPRELAQILNTGRN